MKILKAKNKHLLGNKFFNKHIKKAEVRIFKNGGIIFDPYGFGCNPKKLYNKKIKFTDYYVLFYKSDLKRKPPKPDLFKGVVEIKNSGGFLGKCSSVSPSPTKALAMAQQKAEKRYYRILDAYIGKVYFKKWQQAIAFLFWYLKKYKKEEFKYPELHMKYEDNYYIIETYIKKEDLS